MIKHEELPRGRGILENYLAKKRAQMAEKLIPGKLRQGRILDIGCGPGFFSIDMAQLVGKSGRVIASDLQEGMLQKIRDKIKGTELEDRITLHKCEENKIGVSEHVDFILLFYMVHEVPDVEGLFSEIETILKPKGQVFIVEPPFHVSKSAFENTVKKANDTGLSVVERPKLFLNKAVILKKG